MLSVVVYLCSHAHTRTRNFTPTGRYKDALAEGSRGAPSRLAAVRECINDIINRCDASDVSRVVFAKRLRWAAVLDEIDEAVAAGTAGSYRLLRAEPASATRSRSRSRGRKGQ